MESRKSRRGGFKGNSTMTIGTSTTSRATNTTATSLLCAANSISNVSSTSTAVTNSQERIKPSSLPKEAAEWAERIKGFGWPDIVTSEPGKKVDGIQMMLSIVQHANKMLHEMQASASKQNSNGSVNAKGNARARPKRRTEAGPSWRECKSCGIPIQKSCSAPSQRHFGIQVQQDRITAATQPKRAVAGQPKARKTLPLRRLETPKSDEPKEYYSIESSPADPIFYVGSIPTTDIYSGSDSGSDEAVRPQDQPLKPQPFTKPPRPALPLHKDHESPFRISLHQEMIMRYIRSPDRPYYQISPELHPKRRKRKSRSQARRQERPRRSRPRSFPRATYFAIWPQIMLRKSSSWPELCLRKLFYEADEWLFT